MFSLVKFFFAHRFPWYYYFIFFQGVVDTINYGTRLTRGKLVVCRSCFVEQMTSSPLPVQTLFFFVSLVIAQLPHVEG